MGADAAQEQTPDTSPTPAPHDQEVRVGGRLDEDVFGQALTDERTDGHVGCADGPCLDVDLVLGLPGPFVDHRVTGSRQWRRRWVEGPRPHELKLSSAQAGFGDRPLEGRARTRGTIHPHHDPAGTGIERGRGGLGHRRPS
jgi:hypothetical protein